MSFKILHPDELNASQKNWLAIAICGAILADGNIAPEEMSYLQETLSFLPSQAQVETLIQAVKEQKLPTLGQLPDGSRTLEAQIFIELVLVLTSDGCLSIREMEYLFNIGAKLGFGKEYTRLVIRWASEEIVLHRKMLQLIQSGSELEAEYE
ncbi:TerB family tellurite resistance protein [Deltaproteobacteria bacterium TL4]